MWQELAEAQKDAVILEEVGESLLNDILRVRHGTQSVIAKMAPPYIQVSLTAL